MQISIADRTSDPVKLASLFVRNLSAEYISHSELQGLRALAPDKWSPDIETVIRNEIAERLRDPADHFPRGSDWDGVVQATESGAVIGLSLVSMRHDAAVPFGVIEDVVVDHGHRAKGHGKLLIEWIVQEFARAGVKRVFLESGRANRSAHRLFHELGFETVSEVMVRDL